jgi:hypothetical protein
MNQINDAAVRVNAISHENRESIEDLIQEISRFKADPPAAGLPAGAGGA